MFYKTASKHKRSQFFFHLGFYAIVLLMTAIYTWLFQWKYEKQTLQAKDSKQS